LEFDHFLLLNLPSAHILPSRSPAAPQQLAIPAMSTLVPSFEFKLGSSICSGMVCVGRFDGAHNCLAAAAPNGNVLLHDPLSASNAVKTLSFGRSIRGLSSVPGAALIARKLQQSGQRGASSESQDNGDRDMLLLGGDTTAHVFDVNTPLPSSLPPFLLTLFLTLSPGPHQL
jgi:hypothetical protein